MGVKIVMLVPGKHYSFILVIMGQRSWAEMSVMAKLKHKAGQSNHYKLWKLLLQRVACTGGILKHNYNSQAQILHNTCSIHNIVCNIMLTSAAS